MRSDKRTVAQGEEYMEHTDTGRRGIRMRGKGAVEASATASGFVEAGMDAGRYGWNGGWPQHLTENELLQVSGMPSISPNMLRTGAIGVRSIAQYAPQPGGQTDASTFAAALNQVKFVNATVEILQNQIRKEEAPKKKRTRTTPEQLRILQKAFTADPMPNSGARLALAKKLGMNARAVQVWFQNRRAKEKLEAKRAEAGVERERAGSYHNVVVLEERPDPVVYAKNCEHLKNLQYTEDGGEALTHPIYDLGMYFGDPSLAQYSNGFDMTAYNYTIDNMPQHQLFDDINASENSSHEVTSNSEANPVYARFHSIPAVSLNYADMNNSLGIVFEMSRQDDSSPSASSSLGGNDKQEQYHRSNSIDVLSMMGDAASFEAQSKIFSTPASREAFLTVPLGQSIPMPAKQRSVSVPELPNITLQYQAKDTPPIFRGNDLLSINEEDATATENNTSSSSVKRIFNADIPSSNILGSFSGLQGMVALDDIQAYLDGMSMPPRYEI